MTAPVEGDATLGELAVNGVLSPAFEPNVREYEVVLPLFTTRLVLNTGERAETSVSVNGRPVDASGSWTSGPLEVGTTSFAVELTQGGLVVGAYRLNAVRHEATLSYVGDPDAGWQRYGETTAISRDGNTLAIGAYRHDDQRAQGVRLLSRTTQGWVETGYLQPPQPAPNDTAGWTLSLSADGQRLLVGAPLANVVYIFENNAGSWEFAAELSEDGTARFGAAVELSADGETIAVADDGAFGGEGNVYLYARDGQQWKRRATIPTVDSSEASFGCTAFRFSLALDETGKTLALARAALVPNCASHLVIYSEEADWMNGAYFGPDEESAPAEFATAVDMNLAGTVVALGGSVAQIYRKDGADWDLQWGGGPVTTVTKLSDAGETLVTEHSVFARVGDSWTPETDYPWPRAVPENVALGVALSGDGTTLALGPFVYTLGAANWRELEDPPEGHSLCVDLSDIGKNHCRYELACAEESVDAVCDEGGEDGTWRCVCFGETESELKHVVLTGATRDDACGAAASLCLAGAAPSVLEEDCARSSSAYGDGCSLTTTCTTTLAPAEGIRAVQTRTQSGASCNPWEGQLGCSCSPDDPFIRHVLGNSAPERACDVVQDLCEDKLTIGEEIRCLEPAATESDVGCETTRTCGFSVEIDEPGAYMITDPKESSAACHDVDGAVECSCNPAHGHGYAYVSVDTNAFDEACRVTDALCVQSEALVPSEDVACGEVAVSVQGDGCTADAWCGKVAQYAGTVASLMPYLALACTSAPTGGSDCACVSGSHTLESTIHTTSRGALACEDAVRSCADLATGVDLYAEDGVSLTFD